MVETENEDDENEIGLPSLAITLILGTVSGVGGIFCETDMYAVKVAVPATWWGGGTTWTESGSSPGHLRRLPVTDA